MIQLRLFFTIAVTIIWGWIIVSIIVRNDSRSLLEKIALSFVIGLGTISWLMFLINQVNIFLNYWLILLLLAGFGASLITFAYYKRIPLLTLYPLTNTRPASSSGWLNIFLSAAILLKCAYVYFTTTVKPVMDFDALWRHSLIAKGIFLDKTFKTPFIIKLVTDNPMFISFAQSWIFFGLGGWQDNLGKSVFALLFICLVALFFENLKKDFNHTHALLFTFLLSSLPFLVYHAATAYADFPQTVYYALGTLYLFYFIKAECKNRADLMLSALMLGLGVFIKRHGFYLFFIDLFVLLLALQALRPKFSVREKLICLAIFFLPFILVTLSWATFNQDLAVIAAKTISAPIASIHPSAEANQALGTPALQRLVLAIPIFYQKMFMFNMWHLAWLLLIICLLFFPKKVFRPPLSYLLLTIAINLAYVFISLTFTHAFEFLLDGTLMNRIMLYQMPLVLLFAAFAVPEIGGKPTGQPAQTPLSTPGRIKTQCKLKR
jgi:hypothetical protein